MPNVAEGQQAPDFTPKANDGSIVTLSSFRGKKNVVLYKSSYPHLANTPKPSWKHFEV